MATPSASPPSPATNLGCGRHGCVYTPPEAPGGTYPFDEVFTYTMSDGYGNTDTATVTAHVVANSPPDAVDDEVIARSGTQVLVNVLSMTSMLMTTRSASPGSPLPRTARSNARRRTRTASSCAYTSRPALPEPTPSPTRSAMATIRRASTPRPSPSLSARKTTRSAPLKTPQRLQSRDHCHRRARQRPGRRWRRPAVVAHVPEDGDETFGGGSVTCSSGAVSYAFRGFALCQLHAADRIYRSISAAR